MYVYVYVHVWSCMNREPGDEHKEEEDDSEEEEEDNGKEDEQEDEEPSNEACFVCVSVLICTYMYVNMHWT